jgi:hypothetical protein
MRSPNRLHERQSFFKYLPADTARIVLAARSLRWSSPVLFNDPFDVPRELSFGLTPKSIVEAIPPLMANLVNHPPDDTSNLNDGIRIIVETVKRGISEDLKAELLEGLRESAAAQCPSSESMDALRDIWRSSLIDLRILCFSESPAHMAMWHHYADKYRGAVLEFRCSDAHDSAWLAARPVTYSLEKPAIYTSEGWASLLMLRSNIGVKHLLDLATYTKSSDWSYEQEWRITSTKRPADTGPFTDYKFHPEEFAAIYLGPKINPADADALIGLSAKYPHASVWRAEVGMSRDLLFRDVEAQRNGIV